MKKLLKIKAKSNETFVAQVPVKVIKHRLIKSDPTYKFHIKASINVLASTTIREKPNNQQYYDLKNIVAPTQSRSIGYWINAVETTLGVSLNLGGDFPSEQVKPLFFQTSSERDLFDAIHNDISTQNPAEGVSEYIDFCIFPSMGFIKNKLALDIENIRQDFFQTGISLNVLSFITEKASDLANFTIDEKYINLYDYNVDERFLLTEMLKYNSEVFPQFVYNENLQVNYFWDVLNRYRGLTSEGRSAMFGFSVDWSQVNFLNNQSLKIDYNQNNLPYKEQVSNLNKVSTAPIQQASTAPPLANNKYEIKKFSENYKDLNRDEKVQKYKLNNHTYFKR